LAVIDIKSFARYDENRIHERTEHAPWAWKDQGVSMRVRSEVCGKGAAIQARQIVVTAAK